MFDKHLKNTCAKFGAFIQRVTIFFVKPPDYYVPAGGRLRIRNVICIVTYTSSLKTNTHITAVWVARLVVGHAVATIHTR